MLSQIDAKLDAAASELSGIERKSDSSDIDDAQSYVREVERLVDELKRVKGNDPSAERIVSSYPGHVREFRTASEELKKLKTRQPKADEFVRQCNAFDAAMTAKATATKDDPEGADELSDHAKSIGRKGEELLSDAARMWSEVERGRDDTKRFSVAEGRWSTVRGNLHAGAEAIARGWRDDWDNAKRACEEVVKRERHRDVERVLGKLANSRAGRAELRKKLNELLETVSDRLKDVQSQNGTSQVIGAIELTKELDSLLERLKLAAGDDRESRTIASTWPKSVSELRESLEPLKEMKFNQNRADDGESKCETAEKSLEETIKRVVEEREDYSEPDKTIADEAERLGNPIKEGVLKASEVDRQMGDWQSKAKSFGQSDGKWGRVTSNLRDSADRVHAHWRDKFSAMTKACANIIKGSDHPKVKSTTEQWRGKTGSATDQLDRDVMDWVARARTTYRLDCEAMDDMWQAYCGTDWQPNDTDAGERPKQTAAYLQDKMQAAMRPLLNDLPPLSDRVKKLLGKKQTKTRGEDLLAKLDKERKRLDRLSKNNTWHGSNDPIRFFAAEYGKDQHKRLWSSFGCDVPLSADKEARFPGSGHTKPDCINAEKCEVWEFKPDSATGRSDGPRQVSNYREVVTSYYTERHRQKQPAETALGGEKIMKILSSKCVRGDQIVLNVELHLYKMCDNRYECIRD
ncbi:MAG: hypothetical protein WKG01_16065 [Kofleriaceae bacterium]